MHVWKYSLSFFYLRQHPKNKTQNKMTQFIRIDTKVYVREFKTRNFKGIRTVEIRSDCLNWIKLKFPQLSVS